MTIDQSERNKQLLLERISGDTLNDIAIRHSMSLQRAHQIVVREGTRHIDRLELDLMLAQKTGEHPTFVVPFQEQTGWKAALSHFQWCLDRLRGRGVRVKVTTRQTKAGTVFQIEQEPDA